MSALALLGLLHEDILSCDSCASSMSISEPKSLPKCLDCSHSFCFHCLEKMKVGMGIFSTIICPTCNVETTVGISGVEGLNTNNTILRLLHIIDKFTKATAEATVPMSPTTTNAASTTESIFPPSLASLEISSPTNEDEGMTEAVVTCPRNDVGKVIGIGGCTIKSIRQEADCVVEVKRVADKKSPARILMRGTPEKVQKARQLVESALYPDAAGDVEVEQLPIVLTLPLSLSEVGILFELNHNAVANIATTTGADIKLDRTPKAQRVVIVGKPTQAHAAKTAISSIILRDDSDDSPPLVDLMETIVLQPEHYSKLVTSGAGLVSRIAYRTGCDMEVTASSDNADSAVAGGMMVFRGSRMQIDEAKQLFFHIFDNRPISFTQGMNSVGYHPGSISALQSVGTGKFVRRANTFTGQSTTPDPLEREAKSAIARNFTPNITLQRDNSNGSDRLPFSKEASVRLPCDEESLVRLLGPHGTRHAELQEITQCTISIYNNHQHPFVEVRGVPERVNSAAPMVKMVLGGGSAAIAKLRNGVSYNRGISMDMTMTTDERSFSMEDDVHVNDAVSFDGSHHRFDKEDMSEATPRRRHSLRSNSSFSSNPARETRDNCDVIETKHPLSMNQVRELMNITGCCISMNSDSHTSRVCVWGNERQKEYCAILVNTLIGVLAWYQPLNWTDIKTQEVELQDILPTKVKEIEASSNTQIIVDKSSCTCRIYGASVAVDTAIQLLERQVFVSQYGVSPLRRVNSTPESSNNTPSPLPMDTDGGSSVLRETMRCPSNKIAQIIGKKGSIIKEVKHRSGCDMQVETKATADGAVVGIVQLSGSAEQLRVAKELLGFIMNVGPAEALGMEVCQIVCPKDKVPLVIGAKGATSREMMRRSGCKIHVNEANTFYSADKMCCNIELTGTKAQIADATLLLEAVMLHGTKALGKRFKKTTNN